jgi:hypothetical protein
MRVFHQTGAPELISFANFFFRSFRQFTTAPSRYLNYSTPYLNDTICAAMIEPQPKAENKSMSSCVPNARITSFQVLLEATALEATNVGGIDMKYF